MSSETYSERGGQRLDDLKTMRDSMPIMMEDIFNVSEEFDWVSSPLYWLSVQPLTFNDITINKTTIAYMG